MKIEYISPKKLKPDPNQPRKFFSPEKLKELMESIKKHGIIHPLTVDNDNIIVHGECRRRAVLELKMRKVPIIRISTSKGIKRKMKQVAEGYHRNQFEPIELAKALDEIRTFLINKESRKPYHKKEGYDKGIALVSRETGIPESTVRNSLRLLEAPQPAQEAVNTGYISQTDLFEIEKLSEEQQKELLKKIEERKLENKDREKIKSRAATSIPLIRSDYKDIVIEWIDSGKDLLEIKMIEKLKPDFAKLIKVKFDERFIPFYNALKEKAK